MTLGEKIYSLRKKNGMSQEDVANQLGLRRQTISKWELDTSVPDIKNLKLLAEIFGVSVDYLLSDEISDNAEIYIPPKYFYRLLLLTYKENFRKPFFICIIISFTFLFYSYLLRFFKVPLNHFIWKTALSFGAPLLKFWFIWGLLLFVYIYLEIQIINSNRKPKEC